jgi:adenosylhomocysteine nucleosidase
MVIALPREIPVGFGRIDDRHSEEAQAFVTYRSASAIAQHVAVQAGVGRTRAAEGARFLIRRFSPRALVSFGFAGGLTSGLARGTVIIGTEAVGEGSSRTWAANCDLVAQFRAAAEAEQLPVQEGRVVTSHQLVADPVSKAALQSKSGACAVDMETIGVVEVAHEGGLPWTAVRAVVDSATDTLPPSCLAMLREDGHVAMGRFVRMICRSPQQLRYVLWLAGSMATARWHLSQTFERWTKCSAVQRHQ